MFTRDIERLARSMAAQRMDPVYIRHYIMENYQVDVPTADKILAKAGIVVPQPGAKGSGKHQQQQMPGMDAKQADRRSRQGF